MAVLPEEVTRHIDWSTLRVEPGSFIDSGDTDRFADLLFSARASGSEAFFYVLFEHQSTVDRFMPPRLLGSSAF
jgi:predicted transposase YdaD